MKNVDFLEIKKAIGKKVKLNEQMSDHTTLKIGGPAKLYVDADTVDDLKSYIKTAQKFKIPFMVIGEGSNLLVSDEGFEGFIICNKTSGIKINSDKVYVKAGTNLQEFINFIINKGFSGMEKMSGIPGSVGGAIYGNAGAYGQVISDTISKVEVFDGKKTKWFVKEDCKFGYRDSIFKKKKMIIIGGEFIFERGITELLKRISVDTISLRSQKYPAGTRCPGSFFKNIIANEVSKNILKRIPSEKIVYGKIPAGYLLEEVDAKGKQKGSVRITDYHANLIVNVGNGNARDFYDLAFEYAIKVKNKFGLNLEPEVQLIGTFSK